MSKHFHKIAWEDGFAHFNDVKLIVDDILGECDSIYVKRLEKVKWCKDLFNINASNIEDMWTFNEENYKQSENQYFHRCIMHEGKCAIENVHRIYNCLHL